MIDYLLVDGLNVFMRHFAANPTTSGNGESVGGVVGFLRGLKNLIDMFGPQNVVVVWEGGGSPRRRAIDPNYKQSRRPVKLNRWYDEIPSTVGNRNDQINLLIQFLRLGPIKQIYVPDCEADDIIGYLSNFELKGRKIVIATSDKDYYQLISPTVNVWSPGQKKLIDEAAVLEKFGISVNNFVAARCFCGDSSDGISGAKGVGFKSLAKRIPALASKDELSVADIVNAAATLSTNSNLKLYKSIVDHKERAALNWKLMYLGTNNLSADQISRTEFQINQKPPGSKKLDFMRLLHKNQIVNFDVYSYFMSLNFITNKN